MKKTAESEKKKCESERILPKAIRTFHELTQAFQLYLIFVKRRLPLIRSFFPLILFPWIVTAAVHHIEFRFDELRDLWQGILVSSVSIAAWITAYMLNEIHDNISWLQVASRFLLLVLASILFLAFFFNIKFSTTAFANQLEEKRIQRISHHGSGFGHT